MKPTKSKELLENIVDRITNLYNNEDFYGIDFYNELIKDIIRLYHKDMRQIKIDLDMYECRNWPRETVKRIPADSWVYIYQDEGGVLIYNDTKEYCYSFDYNVAPEEIFYAN